MAAQYELLKELLNSGTKLDFGQEMFFKFYQAFILNDRWVQYIQGVGTTLLVTAIALALGVVLGSVVALVRVAHDQQRPGRRNPVLGFFNAVCQVYTTIIRGTPMMVQLLIMSMVIFSNSRNFTMVGALALGINSGAYVSEIIRGGLMAVDPGQMEAGRSLGLNYPRRRTAIDVGRYSRPPRMPFRGTRCGVCQTRAGTARGRRGCHTPRVAEVRRARG